MLNLLRSDFYRLFRSRAFYICTLVAIFLHAIGIFVMKWSITMVSNMNTQVEGVPLTLPYKDGLSYGLSALSDGNVHLLIAIFISVFITAEFTHGTMKNVVSKGFQRLQIYLSKFVTMITAAFLMICAMVIISTICGTIVIGSFGSFTGTMVGLSLSIIGVEFLLHAALTAMFILVAMVVRSSGGVIAINILGMSLAPAIYSLIEYIFKNKFQFSKYGLLKNIQFYYLNTTATGEDFIRSILVGLVFLAASTAIGIFAFKKMDVK
jgi:ABC-2 type transport system permease protein